MAQRFFVFLQFEFPWELGPSDGRYLLRRGLDAEPERVLVLAGVRPAGGARTGREPSRRGALLARLAGPATVEPSPDPVEVMRTRVSVIDPVSLSAEHQARAWLDGMDAEHEVLAALGVINRLLYFHRIASADPYVHEVSPAQALVVRGGWGEGEQVAEGLWLQARELRVQPRGRRSLRSRRSRDAVLRPQERLAALLGARTSTLLCEELTLRARLDLDQDRPALAALELDRALAAAIGELRAESREDLAIRVAELEQLHPGVSEQARARSSPDAPAGAPEPDPEVLGHALGRLEAALRARTAPGLG